MHRVGELYDEIIDLISDPERIPDSAFNEASYRHAGLLGRLGTRLQAVAANRSTPKAISIPATIPLPANRRRLPDSLAHRDAHVQVERAATRAQAVKALRALAAQGEAPHLKEDETGEPSHFERFVQIYKEFKALKTAIRSCKPTPGSAQSHHPEGLPQAAPEAHHLHRHRPDDEVAAHYFAQLFNQRYRLLLTYLAHTLPAGAHPAVRTSRVCAAW